VSLRRGFIRVGLGLAALWLVFWTCAYVIGAPQFENATAPAPSLSLTMDIVLTGSAILILMWIVSGFRSN